MEQFGIIAKNESRKPLTTSSGSNSLERQSKNESEFQDKILLIVNDSFELSSQDVSMEKKVARAALWSRVLFDCVPSRDLQASFDRAFALHTTPFPVNAYEIKAAYELIRAEHEQAAKEAAKQDRTTNAPKYCKEKSMHVNESGDIAVADPMDRSKDLILPCPVCRPKANEEARKRHAEGCGVKYDPTAKELIDSIPVRPSHLAIPESASEIIAKARDEVGREILRDPDNGVLRAAHEILAGAAKYVYENPWKQVGR